MDRAEARAVASMCISPYGQSVLTPGCLELGRQRCHQSLEEQAAQAAGSVSAKEERELGGDHRPVRASWVGLTGIKINLKMPRINSRRSGLKMMTLGLEISHPYSFPNMGTWSSGEPAITKVNICVIFAKVTVLLVSHMLKPGHAFCP